MIRIPNTGPFPEDAVAAYGDALHCSQNVHAREANIIVQDQVRFRTYVECDVPTEVHAGADPVARMGRLLEVNAPGHAKARSAAATAKDDQAPDADASPEGLPAMGKLPGGL